MFPGVHLKWLQKFKAVYKSGQLIFVLEQLFKLI